MGMYRKLLNLVLLITSFSLLTQFYIDKVSAANPISAEGGEKPAEEPAAAAGGATPVEEPAKDEEAPAAEEPAKDEEAPAAEEPAAASGENPAKKEEGGLLSSMGIGSPEGKAGAASEDGEKSFYERHKTAIWIGVAILVCLMILGVVFGVM